MTDMVQLLKCRPAAYTKGERAGQIFGYECQFYAVSPLEGVFVLNVHPRVAEPLLKDFEVIDANGNKAIQKLIPPGVYELSFGLSIGFTDRKGVGSLKTMTPAGRGNAVLAAGPQAAAHAREQQRNEAAQAKA